MEQKIVFTKGQVEKALEMMDDLRLSYVIRDAIEKDPLKFPRHFFASFTDVPEVAKKIEELQRDYGMVIYYATHCHMPFGECVSFLYVSTYPEDWPVQTVRALGENKYIVNAYVWNMSDEKCSEFGSIVVENRYGMLIRLE